MKIVGLTMKLVTMTFVALPLSAQAFQGEPATLLTEWALGAVPGRNYSPTMSYFRSILRADGGGAVALNWDPFIHELGAGRRHLLGHVGDRDNSSPWDPFIKGPSDALSGRPLGDRRDVGPGDRIPPVPAVDPVREVGPGDRIPPVPAAEPVREVGPGDVMTSVPEPASMALLATGLVLLAAVPMFHRLRGKR